MIEIRRLNGTNVLRIDDIPEGALVHRELMGDHYAQIPFTLAEPIHFRLGDYVVLPGFGRFELTEPYSPKYNDSNSGYDYELRLDAYYVKWKNKKVRYMPTNAASETSFHLTATINVHLAVITRGINALGALDANFLYEGTEFVFQLKNMPEDKADVAKYKQYDNTDFISALNDLATIYDCEWWVEGNIIYFGKCKVDGNIVDFIVDDNVESMGSSASSSDYATRVVAFGSTRNLPSDYRKDVSADITKDGIVQKRLMLPITGIHACPHGYVQSDGLVNETEAIEAIFVDDNIYPRTECVVSSIETYDNTYEDKDTGEEITRTYYRLYDSSGFNFSTDYILEGETLHILFQSGKMNGMDFECSYSDKDKYYEVVLNEDYGRPLPDTSLHPEVGDKFVLYNWDSTKIGSTGLIEAAEEELYQSVLAKLANMAIDPNTYNCNMTSSWYEEKMVSENFLRYDLGQPVRLQNPTYFVEPRESRVIGYEIKLDFPYDTPEYIVGEAQAYSRSKDTQAQLDALTYNGAAYQGGGTGGAGIYLITSTSTTPASDINAYSAKRSDKQFLRRDRGDTAFGPITHKEKSIHEKGAQFGPQFIGGLVGVGGQIDGDGNAELRSLKLNEWFEAPEFRCNKVSIYIGIHCDTFGGGIIEEITPDTGANTGTGKLKLEDGEYGAIQAGDLCMGIWHDWRGGNATETTDDRKGKFSFAGFKTVYFQITNVSGAQNESFSYMLRSTADGGNGVHPFVGMHFAGRGNIEDAERQSFSYTTTEYYLSLHGVKTWEFQPAYFSEIRGNLEGFSMPAIDREGNPYLKVFHGYGQVFGNAYIFGGIDEFERQAYTMEIDQSLNGSLAPRETEQVTLTIRNGYGEDVTSQFTKISVTRTTGDEATDNVWNAKHTSVGNPFDISFSDLGIDGISKFLAVFHVIAENEVTSEQSTNELDYFS